MAGPQTERDDSTAASTEPDWVTIPAGTFTIGVDAVRADGTPSHAAPAHSLHVDAFRIARGPVSVAEFARFVEATSYVTTAEDAGRSWVWVGGEEDIEPGQDHLWVEIEGAAWNHPRGPDSGVASKSDHPVTHVSYEDCLAYCRWSGTRLPTEAEWEKAARGTDGRRYAWGDSPPTPASCNFGMNVGDTTPIGTYPDASGPFGLHDISGNVWEWTSSPWRGYPLTEDIPGQVVLTPRGPAELVVIRGASFFNDCSPLGLGVTSRVYSLREYTGYDIGFRVCALETGQ